MKYAQIKQCLQAETMWVELLRNSREIYYDLQINLRASVTWIKLINKKIKYIKLRGSGPQSSGPSVLSPFSLSSDAATAMGTTPYWIQTCFGSVMLFKMERKASISNILINNWTQPHDKHTSLCNRLNCHHTTVNIVFKVFSQAV